MLLSAAAVRALMNNSPLTEPEPPKHELLLPLPPEAREMNLRSNSDASETPSNAETKTTSNNNDGRWDFMYQGLVEYHREHKTLKVPRHAAWNGQSLYEWIRNNRKHYLNGLKGVTPALSQRRIQALQAIGFDFDPTGVLGKNDAYDDKRWVAMFEGLVEYQRKFGNFSVPVGYLCDGRSLLDWLRHQRSQFTNTLKGLRPALSKERTQRLVSIGFDLDPTGQRQDKRTEQERWEIMFQGLYEFYQKNGSFVLPEGYSYDGRSLFSWARNQRRLYTNYLQGTKPCLSQDRLESLLEIGFIQARCHFPKSNVVIPHKTSSPIKHRPVRSGRPTRRSQLTHTRRQLPNSKRLLRQDSMSLASVKPQSDIE